MKKEEEEKAEEKAEEEAREEEPATTGWGEQHGGAGGRVEGSKVAKEKNDAEDAKCALWE